jgi:hypothetical protein
VGEGEGGGEVKVSLLSHPLIYSPSSIHPLTLSPPPTRRPLLVLCADIKAKKRAADAGISYGLAKVLASRLPDSHVVSVRARMLISDLLQIPDMQVGAVCVRDEREGGKEGERPAADP